MPVLTGKGNRTRKTLSFFSVNFGLTPPYEILCDGPIIFQSLKNDLYLKQSLPKLLGAPSYPVVTECVVNELRRLGEDFTNAALFAKRAKRVPCVHDGKADVAECLLSRLRNPSHAVSILATNDPEVSKKATRVPGVAIVSILNQKLMLQAPSLATTDYVKRSQKTKIHSLSDPDRALVQEIKAAEDSLRKNRAVKKKRKRAQGPNPLSVKKSREIRKRPLNGTHGATATLENSPSNRNSRDDEKDKPAAEFEEPEGFSATHPHQPNGSPAVVTGESGRKRKRRRRTNQCTERDLGSDDAGNGIAVENGLPQREDQSSSPDPDSVEQQSKQVGKRQSAMGVVIADDIGPSTGKASSQQDQGSSPPAANNMGTDAHQRVQQLSSTTQARGQTPAKNDKVAVLKNTHSDSQRCQEEKASTISFNERMSNASRDTSASGQITEPLPLTCHDEVESRDDSRVPPHEHAGTNDDQLVAIDRIEADEELADKNAHAAQSGGRTKKHRKNRRRRPKKNTSG